MNRMQQMQDWLLLQKEQELAQLRIKYDEQSQELSRLAVQNALLQEKLQQQEGRMQHELRLIKLAAFSRAESQKNRASTKERVDDLQKQSLEDEDLTDSPREAIDGSSSHSWGQLTLTTKEDSAAARKQELQRQELLRVFTASETSEDRDYFDPTGPTTVPSNNPGFYKSKPGPLVAAQRQQQNLVAANENARQPMEAPSSSLFPPQTTQQQAPIQTSSSSDEMSFEHVGVPTNIDAEDGQVPTVPLTEEVTFGDGTWTGNAAAAGRGPEGPP